MNQREILFKGQGTSEHGVIIGSYLKGNDCNHYIRSHVDFKTYFIEDPGTIVQYSEYNDKTGSRLFDKDRVLVFFPNGWHDDNFVIQERETIEMIVEWFGGWFIVDPFDTDRVIFMQGLDSADVQLTLLIYP